MLNNDEPLIMYLENDVHGLIVSNNYVSRLNNCLIVECNRIKKFINNEYWSVEGLVYIFGINGNVLIKNALSGKVISGMIPESMIRLPDEVFGQTFLNYTANDGKVKAINFNRPLFTLIVGQRIIIKDDDIRIIQNAVVIEEVPKIILIIDHNGTGVSFMSNNDMTITAQVLGQDSSQ